MSEPDGIIGSNCGRVLAANGEVDTVIESTARPLGRACEDPGIAVAVDKLDARKAFEPIVPPNIRPDGIVT
jgi:hypothetical protein